MATLQRELPLFPLERVVLFPGMPLPLQIFEERYKVMIGTCELTDRLFGVVLIRAGREVGAPAITEMVGCTARITRLERVPDGRIFLVATGEQRFHLLDKPQVAPEGYLFGQAQIDDGPPPAEDIPSQLVSGVRNQLARYVDGLAKQSRMAVPFDPEELNTEPAQLSYRAAALLRVQPAEQQKLLEADGVAERLQMERLLLRRENQMLTLMQTAPTSTTSTDGPFSLN